MTSEGEEEDGNITVDTSLEGLSAYSTEELTNTTFSFYFDRDRIFMATKEALKGWRQWLSLLDHFSKIA